MTEGVAVATRKKVNPLPDLYTLQEIRDFTGATSIATIYGWTRKNRKKRLHTVRIGREVRVTALDLRRFLGLEAPVANGEERLGARVAKARGK
jgi:hypothetical protein